MPTDKIEHCNWCHANTLHIGNYCERCSYEEVMRDYANPVEKMLERRIKELERRVKSLSNDIEPLLDGWESL